MALTSCALRVNCYGDGGKKEESLIRFTFVLQGQEDHKAKSLGSDNAINV